MEISDTEETAYLAFLFGMWFHTRELVGKPTRAEAEQAMADLPPRMREDVIEMLGSHNQLALPDLSLQ
jgi:hypothetical protein